MRKADGLPARPHPDAARHQPLPHAPPPPVAILGTAAPTHLLTAAAVTVTAVAVAVAAPFSRHEAAVFREARKGAPDAGGLEGGQALPAAESRDQGRAEAQLA